jgi:hypothetical protein
MPTIRKNPLKKFREIFDEVPPPKGGLPTMPTRVSDLTSDELGNLISRYTAWREYTEDRHIEACAVFAECKSKYDMEYTKQIVASKFNKITDKRYDAKVSSEELLKDLEEAEMYKDLLAGKLESFTNVLTMLSRELTRRGVDSRV